MLTVKSDDITNLLEGLSPAIEAIIDPNIKLIINQLMVVIKALRQENEELREENVFLRQENEGLKEKLKTNSKNSSAPPSSDGFRKEKRTKQKKGKSKRKQGGQPGRTGVGRTLFSAEEVDVCEVVKPSKECSCGGLVIPTSNYQRHQVHELPKIKPIVTEYQLYSGRCCACNKKHYASLPAGVPEGMLGPLAMAKIGALTGDFRMSKRNVTFLFDDFYDLRISVGTVSNVEQIVSAALEKSVEEAKAFIPEQGVVHADETSHAEQGNKMWTWAFIAGLAAVFIIRPSRGAQVAKDFLGEAFQGILNTDRWSGYAWLAAIFRQLCWAHLIRDFCKISERKGPSRKIGRELLKLTKKMFRYWHRVRDGTLKREKFQTLMQPLRKQVEALLEEGAQCSHSKTSGTCKQLLKVKQALWTFVDKEGVEPTNNLAEQILRRIVIWRKTSFGTQSSAGTLYLERIMTVVSTCKMQKRNVLDFVSEAIQAHLSKTKSPSLLPLPLQVALPLAA